MKIASEVKCTVVVVGDSRTGKTSLIQRFVNNTFNQVRLFSYCIIIITTNRTKTSKIVNNFQICDMPSNHVLNYVVNGALNTYLYIIKVIIVGRLNNIG